MKKMLMLSSVASMIDQFNMPNIALLKEMGYEVHVATNFEYGSTSSNQRVEEFKKELAELKIPFFQIDFSRKVTDFKSNIKAYKQIKKLMIQNDYSFVHCHSPIGGVCGRLAAKQTKTKAIYTAHGFHFYKGGPIKNWLLYYPIERWLSRYTDTLITINKEDYKRAQTFDAKCVEYIPGVGIDTKKFKDITIDKLEKRKELGILEESFILLSVGELNANKNHETVIRALAKVNNPNIQYVICGVGNRKEYLQKLLNELKLADQVILLGFRKDISEIYKVANVFVFPSFREGLSVALMEAMASGLPVICSDIRGNTDLVLNNKNGFVIEIDDADGFSNSIEHLYLSKELRFTFEKNNFESIKKFSSESVSQIMMKIYEEY